MDTAIFLELERAELSARERRLSAEAEARRIVADAQAEARRLERSVDRRIRRAIDARRKHHAVAAEREIEVLRNEMRLLVDPRAGEAETARTPVDPAIERAVALVVAAVLGEDTGD